MKRLQQKGFTLMEVLVALVILALAFSTVFMGLSTSARNLLHLKNKTAASWVAMNTIAQQQLNLTEPTKNQKMFDKDWIVSTEIVSTPNPEVNQINVAVSARDNQPPLINLIGYARTPQ